MTHFVSHRSQAKRYGYRYEQTYGAVYVCFIFRENAGGPKPPLFLPSDGGFATGFTKLDDPSDGYRRFLLARATHTSSGRLLSRKSGFVFFRIYIRTATSLNGGGRTALNHTTGTHHTFSTCVFAYIP